MRWVAPRNPGPARIAAAVCCVGAAVQANAFGEPWLGTPAGSSTHIQQGVMPCGARDECHRHEECICVARRHRRFATNYHAARGWRWRIAAWRPRALRMPLGQGPRLRGLAQLPRPAPPHRASCTPCFALGVRQLAKARRGLRTALASRQLRSLRACTWGTPHAAGRSAVGSAGLPTTCGVGCGTGAWEASLHQPHWQGGGHPAAGLV